MEVGGHSSRVYSFWGDPIATVTGVFQTSDTRRHRTEDRPFLATRHDDPRGRVDSSIFSASFCVVDVFRFAFAFGFAFGPGEVQSLQHLISWETPMHSSSLSLSLSLSLIQKHLHFFCHIVYTILKISTYVSYVLPFTMTLTVNFPTHAPLTLASPIQGLRAAHGWRARRARGGGA